MSKKFEGTQHHSTPKLLLLILKAFNVRFSDAEALPLEDGLKLLAHFTQAMNQLFEAHRAFPTYIPVLNTLACPHLSLLPLDYYKLVQDLSKPIQTYPFSFIIITTVPKTGASQSIRRSLL